MNIHPSTVARVHNVVKGLRVGDAITSKTVEGAQPYVSLFVKRGHLVRSVRGHYRVLRSMQPDDIKSVIELYNLAQNRKRGFSENTVPAARTAQAAQAKRKYRVRRTRASITEAVYDMVKNLKNGDHLLLSKLGAGPLQRKRLMKTKTILRLGSKKDGCVWNGGTISKDDLQALMFGHRRPYKRRALVSPSYDKRWAPSTKDAALEIMDQALVSSKNGHSSSDAPLTIESNGFRITLSKGSITISK